MYHCLTSVVRLLAGKYLLRQRLCSRLMALWRFINFVLLLLLLLMVDTFRF